jgi:hypothetical protein
MLVILPVTEAVVVWVVGIADTLDREWYVREEAVAPLSKILLVLLLVLVVDEIAGIRLLCSPLPRSLLL